MDEASQFDTTEQKVLRYLHQHYLTDRQRCYESNKIMEATGITRGQWNHLEGRFLAYGILSSEISNGIVPSTYRHVTPIICEVISALEHPPPVNHWKRLKAWWFSKWWTLPLTVLVIGAPVIAQWILWGVALLKWFKGEPGSR